MQTANNTEITVKYRASKYVRLSYTDDKTNESDSIINQKRLIDDFVERNPDIEIVSEKVDDGYSGIIFDRPAFKEMMDDIVSGKINCVIVKDLSRLGRDYIETGRHLRRIFPAYGVRFIAINDNIDTLNDGNGDELAVSVKSIINDAYSRDISVKIRSALNAKRQNGDFVGAYTVYGYLKSSENKNRLVIDEYAARVVRDIFKMRIDGASAARIADELNRLGVLSPIMYKKNKGLPYPKGTLADKDDAKWSATAIIRILKDEIYTGTLIQGKQYRRNYKLRDIVSRPIEERSRTENAHGAIIKKRDFELVQKIAKIDTRTAPNESGVYVFSGVLICGCCGNRMTRKTVPYKGRQYFYYYCPTGKKRGCDASNMVKETGLLECVSASLRGHIQNIISLEELINSLDNENINRYILSQHTSQIKENQARIDKYNKFKAGLYENYVDGVIGKDEYRNYKNQYASDCERLDAENERIKVEIENLKTDKNERMKWIEHFKRFSNFDKLDRAAVVRLIQSIHIFDKTNIKITFNYAQEYETALNMLTNTEKEAV
jgi:DNA invertase Pin-like site-specific DNA recombinase